MLSRQWLWFSCFILVFMLSGCTIHVNRDHSQTNQQTPPPKTAEKKLTGCLTLYEHIYFGGQSKKICDSTPDLQNFDNLISSIKADCDVLMMDLYEEKNYQGQVVSYSDMSCKEIPNLVEEIPVSPVNNPLGGLNDWISSIRIEKKAAD